MKTRPILFSGPMIRAILDGSKTQTRRNVELPPAPAHLGAWERTLVVGLDCAGQPLPERAALRHSQTGALVAFRYGDPGDRLWIKETWRVSAEFDAVPICDIPVGVPVEYRADSVRPLSHPGRWRPSIFMRQWMSRIELEIISGRVERLNEITGLDVEAEGCELPDGGGHCPGRHRGPLETVSLALGVDQRSRFLGRKPVGLGRRIQADGGGPVKIGSLSFQGFVAALYFDIAQGIGIPYQALADPVIVPGEYLRVHPHSRN